MVLSGGVTETAGVTVPVQTNAIELPAGSNYVTYAPEQNNVAYAYSNNPMSFASLPGLPTDTNNANTILIGRTRYPSNSVIASNAVPNAYTATPAQMKYGSGDWQNQPASGYTGPAPSATGLQAQVPQMDPGPMQLGSSGSSLPARFNGPDLEGQAGIPNPYMTAPTRPAYKQGANEFTGPADSPWIKGMPNIMDYMPKPPPIEPGLKGIVQRMQRATPQWQRNNAAAVRYGTDVWKEDKNAQNMIAQQEIAARSGLLQHQMTQQGLDYRTDANNFNSGALATLNHMLDVKAKQTMTYAEAYKAQADAFAMPSKIVGPDGILRDNIAKANLLQAVAPILGLDEAAVRGLMQVQDPKAANELQLQALNIQKEAIAVKHSKERFRYELQQMAATTRNTNATAASQEFTNGMNRSIEVGLRAGALADAMDKVTNHYVHQQLSKSQVESANQGARAAYFNAQKARLEAAGVPLAAATKMIEVQQKLLASAGTPGTDPAVAQEQMALAMQLRDSAFAAIGITTEQKPVMVPGPSKGDPMVPQIGPDGQPVMTPRLRQNMSPAALQMGGMVNQGMYNGQYQR